jgi:predicted phage-related endonuclease
MIAANERMDWGNALEAAIAQEVGRRNNWKVEPEKNYWQLPNARLGSSFDFFIAPTNGSKVYTTILEIKNVDSLAFNRNWQEDEDDIQAPPHIELQVQFQMMISGMSSAYIAALVGGNQLKLTKPRQANLKLHEIMLAKCEKFWQSVTAKQAPKIDYERDSEFLISLYDFAEPNKVIDADEFLDAYVHGYNTASQAIKEFETQKEMFKAKILEHIKDAEKVKGAAYTISAGITPEAPVSYVRKSFRNFRITNKKQTTTNPTATQTASTDAQTTQETTNV